VSRRAAACDDRGELGRLLGQRRHTRCGQAIEEVRGGKVDVRAPGDRQALEKYSIDLTERATSGSLTR
jgi:ATP-dependent Clp protease ATP-binding subunit ClpB